MLKLLMVVAAVAATYFWLGAEVAIPSYLMGAGIAIDVTLATVARFRDNKLSLRNWTIPITVTHIGLPALGYYGFWGLSVVYPWLSPVLGTVGAVLVFLFLYELTGDWVGYRPIISLSGGLARLVGFKPESSRRLAAIMAVSWDALWSGPAKAAQATSGAWRDSEVGLSFVVAGLVVAVAAQVSLAIALRLRRREFRGTRQLAGHIVAGFVAESVVIGGFGILSLLQGWSLAGNLYHAIIGAGTIVGFVCLCFYRPIWTAAVKEAEAAIRS